MWGAACNQCNCDELTNKRKWPLARQLAIKWLRDREHFDLGSDLATYNAIRRGLKIVKRFEVVIWICREVDQRKF